MDIFTQIGIFLWETVYIWVAIFMIATFSRVWLKYIRRQFIASMDWVMLEIKVPREVHKSPAAMEIVLNALHDTGGTGNWYVRWWKGKVRSWFSLEMVSIEGSIYFFIRTQRRYIPLINANLYSQYPGAQIREVDDYTRYIPRYKRNNGWSMFGFELKLGKADPYPLKTYIDYGMDQDLSMDEEKRIDPITPILEMLSSMRTTEHVWIQIMLRAATKRHKDPSAKWWQTKTRSWIDAAKDEIKKFRTSAIKENLGVLKEVDPDKDWSSVSLTEVQKETLTSLERSITKRGFDVGMRVMYLAQDDHFRPDNIAALINMFKVYGHEHLNSLRPSYATDLNYAWEDFRKTRIEAMKEEIFDAYIHRKYFYPFYPKARRSRLHDVKREQYVLNTEELATIFHLPSSTAETPAFERIDSQTAQPPANLPF